MYVFVMLKNWRVVIVGVSGDAVWSVQLDARPAGGPYNLTVTLRTATLVLTDILFGDAWICSGQSNMEFTLRKVRVTSEMHSSGNFAQLPVVNCL